MHLLTARQNGLDEVFSNDERLLAAASEIGIVGRNVIARPLRINLCDQELTQSLGGSTRSSRRAAASSVRRGLALNQAVLRENLDRPLADYQSSWLAPLRPPIPGATVMVMPQSGALFLLLHIQVILLVLPPRLLLLFVLPLLHVELVLLFLLPLFLLPSMLLVFVVSFVHLKPQPPLMLAGSKLELGPEDSERAVLGDHFECAAHGQHHGSGRNTGRNRLNMYDETSTVA